MYGLSLQKYEKNYVRFMPKYLKESYIEYVKEARLTYNNLF
jgi:hypothetical protein